jgi:large subunit ribosomal protein L19
MSNSLLQSSTVVTSQLRTDIPEFHTGAVIDVYYKIKEGNKERVQVFSGIVTNVHNKTNLDATFTVLKVASGSIKVERTFPIHSPFIDKVVIKSNKRAKKANLRYLHNVKDPIKQAKVKPVKVSKTV